MRQDTSRALALLALATSLIALSSCSRGETPQTARAVDVDERGGSVTASDEKLTVTLPAGSVSTSVRLSVRIVEAVRRDGLLGSAYEISPDGVAFGEPALLAFRLDDAALRARADRGELVVARLEHGQWSPLPQSWSEDHGRVVLGLTPHFSIYGLVELGPCSANECPAGSRCFQGECYAACPSDGACDESDPCYNPYRCGAQACQQTTCAEGASCFFGACYTSCGTDAECEVSETCVSGRCVAPDTSADAGTPALDAGGAVDAGGELDAGAADAGSLDAGSLDAGSADAGGDAELTCVDDSDCSGAGATCELNTCSSEGECAVLPTAAGTTFDSSAGYMDGNWDLYVEPVCRNVATQLEATLFLSHTLGASTTSGTFLHYPTGQSGTIGGSLFNSSTGQYSTSWRVNVDESDEILGISCTVVSQNEMSCTHSSTITGSVVDGVLLRR